MIRGPDIDYHINRKVFFNGEYTLDMVNRDGIYIPAEGPVSAEDGETVVLKSPTKVRVKERVVLLRPNPALFEIGLVSYPQLIDSEMGETEVKVRVELELDVKIDLTYLAKLYLF